MTDRRRIARGIAVAITSAFLVGGIVFLARDVAVDPPVPAAMQTPTPSDTAARRDVAPKDSAALKKKTKEIKPGKPQQKPTARDFLAEPVN